MALSGCSNALAASALLCLLLLPAHYYIPNFPPNDTNKLHVELPDNNSPSVIQSSWLPIDFEVPAVDLFITASLIVGAIAIDFADWIQRKILERRIFKINQYLKECVEELRLWDMRQEKLEVTLKMVQNASSEYNLLLYLLLRQHHLDPTWKTFAQCENELEDFSFTNNVDVCIVDV